MKYYFYTATTTEGELLMDYARSSEAVHMHISELYTTRAQALRAMCEDINVEVGEHNGWEREENEVPNYIDGVKPRDIKDGKYNNDIFEMEWKLESRKVKS